VALRFVTLAFNAFFVFRFDLLRAASAEAFRFVTFRSDPLRFLRFGDFLRPAAFLDLLFEVARGRFPEAARFLRFEDFRDFLRVTIGHPNIRERSVSEVDTLRNGSAHQLRRDHSPALECMFNHNFCQVHNSRSFL
jgi:hypothetical protein